MSVTATIKTLPPEIIWQIVRYTNPQTLRFRLVCQAWNRTLSCCLAEVNAALVGSAIFPFAVQISLNWDLTQCSLQLQQINQRIRALNHSNQVILCSLQVAQLETRMQRRNPWKWQVAESAFMDWIW